MKRTVCNLPAMDALFERLDPHFFSHRVKTTSGPSRVTERGTRCARHGSCLKSKSRVTRVALPSSYGTPCHSSTVLSYLSSSYLSWVDSALSILPRLRAMSWDTDTKRISFLKARAHGSGHGRQLRNKFERIRIRVVLGHFPINPEVVSSPQLPLWSSSDSECPPVLYKK